MAIHARPLRGLAPLLLVTAGLLPLGCGGDAPPPPPTAEEFEKAQVERKAIIQKEYGGTATPPGKKK